MEPAAAPPTLRDRLPVGTFTIVREIDDRWITIRIREVEMARREVARYHDGDTIVRSDIRVIAEYLRGRDNEIDYTGFAFVNPRSGQYTLWKKFVDKPGEAWFRWVLDVLRGDPIVAGQAWARESGRCFRCGRLLTTRESIEIGIGPDCLRMATAGR